MKLKNGICKPNVSERFNDGRKEYSAAKIEIVTIDHDVLTTSGGENGYGVKWTWDIDDLWGE